MKYEVAIFATRPLPRILGSGCVAKMATIGQVRGMLLEEAVLFLLEHQQQKALTTFSDEKLSVSASKQRMSSSSLEGQPNSTRTTCPRQKCLSTMRRTTRCGGCLTDGCSQESSRKKGVSPCSKTRKHFPVFQSTTYKKRRSSMAKRSPSSAQLSSFPD